MILVSYDLSIGEANSFVERGLPDQYQVAFYDYGAYLHSSFSLYFDEHFTRSHVYFS